MLYKYVSVCNRRWKVFNRGGFAFVRGDWHSKNWQKLHWFIVFHVSIWGVWSFVWGAKPLRGDGTEQTVDKSWTSCRSHYIFPTSFYEWV